MPSNAIVKTGWARKALIVTAAAGLLFVIWLAMAPIRAHQTTNLSINSTKYKLEIANSASEQELGLGKRDSIPKDHGMLFKYSTEQTRCFWMKDMRFDLDMIWLDHNKRVVYSVSDLTPQTYPQTYCADNAQYVIELNAGQVAAKHIQNGQILNFRSEP